MLAERLIAAIAFSFATVTPFPLGVEEDLEPLEGFEGSLVVDLVLEVVAAGLLAVDLVLEGGTEDLVAVDLVLAAGLLVVDLVLEDGVEDLVAVDLELDDEEEDLVVVDLLVGVELFLDDVEELGVVFFLVLEDLDEVILEVELFFLPVLLVLLDVSALQSESDRTDDRKIETMYLIVTVIDAHNYCKGHIFSLLCYSLAKL